jgi:uncharacterized membrane protein YkgB
MLSADRGELVVSLLATFSWLRTTPHLFVPSVLFWHSGMNALDLATLLLVISRILLPVVHLQANAAS